MSVLRDEDFKYVCQLLKEQSAIHLEAGKEYLVETRLLPLIRGLGHDTLESYIVWMRQNPFGPNHQKAIEALTTNETLFFRDFHPFETLKKELLPPLLVKRESVKKLQIWSAACSSGQEPYTINMLLHDSFPQLSSWKVSILATDLAVSVLDRAKEGAYSQLEINRGLPAPYLIKYFTRGVDFWRVQPFLQERIQFQPLNLIGAWLNVPNMDIVFLRNVMIYFQPDVKRKILERIFHQMNPGGYLFLGGSETILGLNDQFKSLTFDRTIVYQKPE